jgi:hypothetical protein
VSSIEASSWRRYDQHDRAKTAPPKGELVWVYEEYEEGVTIGFFNGDTMCLWNGRDDYSITHWMHLPAPEPPDEQWP